MNEWFWFHIPKQLLFLRCKENVIGRVCDRCLPGHYAFPDCLQCTCNEDGTTDAVCDQNTAQCFCKKHVRAQVSKRNLTKPNQPDWFLYGWWLGGGVCKLYVLFYLVQLNIFHVQQDCSVCKEEFFNLQPFNPDGCTKCYCFGKTTRCSSSYLSWAEVIIK